MKTKPISATMRTNRSKQAEAALQESEERFRQLSEAAFEAIILHDNGTILEVNQSFCRMYGYERAEVIGKSVLDLALPQFRELLLQRVRSGETEPNEGLALRKDGTIFRAEVAAKPIHYQGRSVRVAAIRDITEQKRNEWRQAAQYAVTRVLADSATLAEAVPQLLKVICESLRWKMGEFWRLCDGTNVLRCEETWHVPEFDGTSFIEASRQTELAPGAGLPGRVWQSGQPAWSSDVTTDPGFARTEIAAEVGLRGAVAFPILLGNVALGVMLFFSRRDPEVDKDLLKIMSAVGSQIGQFAERKRAEEALRESEQLSRSVLEHIDEIIYMVSAGSGDPLRGTVQFVSGRVEQVIGYQPDEFVNDPELWFNLLHPDDVPAVVDSTRKIFQEKQSLTRVYRLRHKHTGQYRWMEDHVVPRLDDAGTVVATFGAARDITNQRHAEEALRESEERFRTLVESAPTGIFVNVDDQFAYVNAALCRILGARSPEELLGTPLFDRIDSGSHAAIRERIARLRTCGESVPLMDQRFRRLDGSIVEVETVATPTTFQGRPAIQVVVNDISARRRAEEALRESEERYRDLVENSRELICTHDLDGLVLSANPAAAAAAGYDLDEYVGKKTIRDLLAPEVRYQFDEYMARLCKDGTTSGMMLVQTISGERRVWEYYNSLRTEGVAAPVVRAMARDITERRQAEDALREREKELNEAQRIAKVGSWTWDIESDVVTWSEELYRRRDIDPAQPIPPYREHQSLYSPESWERLSAAVAECLRTGTPYELEVENTRPDGQRAWTIARGEAIRDASGKVLSLRGTSQDITERTQAEEALRTSERKYRDIFTFAPVGIYQSLRDGTLITANAALTEMLGYASVDEFLKVNLSDVYFTPDDRRKLIREYEGRGYATDLELRWKQRDGTPLWIQLTTHAIKDTDGSTKYFEGFVRDITVRKRAEEALKKSESDYRHLFNNANDAILIFEPEGEIILETNAAACDIYGYSRDELIGTSMKRFTKSVLAGESQIHELLDAGTASNYESIHFNNKGGEIYFLINASVIDYQDRKAILSINHNITERKLQEEALRESETLLKQSQRVAVLGHYVLDFASGLWTNSEVLDEIFGIDAAYTKNVEGWLDIVHPEQRDEMHAYLRDHVLKERNSFDREYRIVRINDGAARWVHGLGNLELNPDGQPARMFGVIQDVTERKQVEEKLNLTAKQLRSLSARLRSAREDEGTRIAREIHDELGASLTGLKWDLEGIDKVLSGAENIAEVQAVRKKLPNMTGLIDSTIDTVRRISAELRPGGLDDLGLVAAIEWQASQLQTRTGIKCKCVTAVNGADMSRERATTVFRIFQEILTNVIRHAHATKVNIELTERDGCLELRVKDNGRGITKEEKRAPGSLGLLGMSERARQFGGEVSISGVQGKGTTVVVRVPTT